MRPRMLIQRCIPMPPFGAVLGAAFASSRSESRLAHVALGRHLPQLRQTLHETHEGTATPPATQPPATPELRKPRPARFRHGAPTREGGRSPYLRLPRW